MRDASSLVVGQHYRVKYLTHGGNGRAYEREMVARYMGENAYGHTDWDRRPEYGTATLPLSEIVSVIAVSPGRGMRARRIGPR